MNIIEVLTGVKSWIVGKLSTIQSGISTINANISTINTKISTAETDIDNIEALIPSGTTTSNKLVNIGYVNGISDVVTSQGEDIGTINNKIPANASSSNKLVSNSDMTTNLQNFYETMVVPVDTKIVSINQKIPTQASASNQLADKNFVNSSIATATATFRGTNTTATTESAFLTWANGLTEKDTNDYVFWKTTDSLGNTVYKRYKYGKASSSATSETWNYEYDLNNSSFTAAQWAAINSGITSTLVEQITPASNEKMGLVKPGEGLKVNNGVLNLDLGVGLSIDVANNKLYTNIQDSASNEDIDNALSSYVAITPSNVAYAVKKANIMSQNEFNAIFD